VIAVLLLVTGVVAAGSDAAYAQRCQRNPDWQCDGDVDGNGAVNPVDVGLVQAAFGTDDPEALCNFDIDCNGAVNPVDAGLVQSLFGTCDPPRPSCPIEPSIDLFAMCDDGRTELTYQDLALPPGFFGQQCQGFNGRIQFVGVPFDPQTTGNASMAVVRFGDPVRPQDPEGTQGQVQVHIGDLHLRSVQPIIVQCGQQPTFWQVEMFLSQTESPPGQITAQKTSLHGGELDMVLPVQPAFEFINVDNPQERRFFDTGGKTEPTLYMREGMPFSDRLREEYIGDLVVDPSRRFFVGILDSDDTEEGLGQWQTGSELGLDAGFARLGTCPARRLRCVYEVSCISGSCGQCPARDGDVFLGPPGEGGCAPSFSQSCGTGPDCCFGYGLVGVRFPADGEMPAPSGDACGCAETEGACCIDPSVCLEGLREVDCADQGGAWQGENVECGGQGECPDQPRTGACCGEEESCTITTEDDCDGIYKGDGSTCEPNPCIVTGACCDDEGACTITTEEGCTGTFKGVGVACDPNPCLTGACCDSDGTCTVSTREECKSGNYKGNGTDCDPNPCMGACCLDTGECRITARSRCPGEYQGDGTKCTPNPCIDCDDVTVTLEEVERAPGLPRSMAHRTQKQLRITISPSLEGTIHEIEVRAVNPGSGAGDVAIVGQSRFKSSGIVTIEGTRQTDPATTRRPSLEAYCGPQLKDATEGFAVCAHPNSVGFRFIDITRPFITIEGNRFWGALYEAVLTSDSGVTDDLDRTMFSELITVERQTGYYANKTTMVSGFIRSTSRKVDRHIDGGYSTDTKYRRALDDAGVRGEIIYSQYFRFSCERCRIAPSREDGPKIPNSGFGIRLNPSKRRTEYFLNVRKYPLANHGVAAGVIDDTTVKTVPIVD
jgi:hypothetical protein